MLCIRVYNEIVKKQMKQLEKSISVESAKIYMAFMSE